MDLPLVAQFGVALGLGLLVGLEREWAEKPIAGIRTFSLITVLGALCSVLSVRFGGWILAAGVLAVAAMLWVGNKTRLKEGKFDAGITTEMAALVMFAVGALVVADYMVLGVVVAGAVAVLLHWKQPLHLLVERIGEQDLRAVVRLILIGMVILPVMPDRAYGPYDVLNPFRIWLMVVLIVGISMAAYVVERLLGTRVGSLLAGVFGGLISSTATTVGYARRSREHPSVSVGAAWVIMVASTVVFGRVLLEIAIVARGFLASIGPPLLVMMGFMVLICVALFLVMRREPAPAPSTEPPTKMTAAIVFGALYAAVLFAVAATRKHFGTEALYVVAALSGLTDMDAITLSTAELLKGEQLDAGTGWRLILVGAMANLVFKGLVVAVIGGTGLLWRVVVLFGVSLAGGAVLLLFWP